MDFIVGFIIYFTIAIVVAFIAKAAMSKEWKTESMLGSAAAVGAILGVLGAIGNASTYSSY